MSAKCTLTINGHTIRAGIGETLVDAALGGRILVPHDCCSGQCETCRVRVVAGSVDDQGTGEGDTVLACLATLAGDAAIAFDEVPAVVKRAGQVASLRRLSPEVVEVALRLREPLTYLPGQYASVAFAGFPARDYSPAPRADGGLDPRELVLHVRVLADGAVSSALGGAIGVGHKVQVRGPFGHAFFRRGDGLLVLVAGGTGWAPIWAVAREACLTQPGRDIVVVVGARDLSGLYMRRSLDWLREHGVREIIMTSEADAAGDVRLGRPTNYLPSLGPQDMVYVAGAPGLVEAVKRKALAAGAFCFADPFLPGTQRVSLVGRVARLLRAPGSSAEAGAPLSPRPARLDPRPAEAAAGERGAGQPAVAAPRRPLQTTLFGPRSSGRR